MGKEQLVKIIAKDLYLREDVVEEVLDRFLDVTIEEIVNTGDVKLHRLLTVSTADYKSYETIHGRVPAHRRLKVKLSDGINRLFKLKEAEPGLSINRDNWREHLAVADRAKPRKSDELYNPLLDEE